MISKPTPRYLKDVLKEFYAKPPQPGSVTIVTVTHEDNCAMLAGRGPCDCRFVVEPGRVHKTEVKQCESSRG